jgi:tRNA(fMet)-specific endonuclease VapC
MRAMLDTSVCIEIMRGYRPSDAFRGWQFKISSIVEAELWAGAYHAEGERESKKVKLLLSAVEVKEFGSKAAKLSGVVLGKLAKKGMKIGDFDSLIAGHCLALELPLITLNKKHFSRIENLELIEWKGSERLEVRG